MCAMLARVAASAASADSSRYQSGLIWSMHTRPTSARCPAARHRSASRFVDATSTVA